jgi:glutathione synthase
MTRRRPSLKILFIADPLPHFDPVAETTLYLMQEAQRRRHRIFWTAPGGLSARGSELYGRVHEVTVLGQGKKDWFKAQASARKKIREFDAVLLRKDPPFDVAYLHHLYLLKMISGETYFMNDPGGILAANEKLMPLAFTDKVPDTLVSANRGELLDFVKEQRGGTILKPLGESGGRGVFYLRGPKADNVEALLETATEGFSRHIVAQAYLPAAKKGDKRILLLGQEILGAFSRKPAPGEHRANLHRGGTARAARVTQADREWVERLRPLLATLGLDFVGLDMIGDALIEVNVTSPMGVHEVNRVHKVRCERRVLDFIEERVTDFFDAPPLRN